MTCGHYLSHVLINMQNDLDCFLLGCYHGKLQIVHELVNRHKMNPHVANEVCVCVHALHVGVNTAGIKIH